MPTVNLTKKNFRSLIENNSILVFDFWAPWCGPCQRFLPIFESLSNKYPDIVFAKINTEEEVEISEQFNIKAIPTLVVIKDQQIILENSGAVNEEVFEKIILRARAVDMSQVEPED